MNLVTVQTPNSHVKEFEDMQDYIANNNVVSEYSEEAWNSLTIAEQFTHQEHVKKYNARVKLISKLRKKNLIEEIFTADEIEKFCPDHEMEFYEFEEDGEYFHGYECATCGCFQTG
jgi:hypothetical protein